jgi:nucleotide-binding universal stress UspA family protein
MEIRAVSVTDMGNGADAGVIAVRCAAYPGRQDIGGKVMTRILVPTDFSEPSLAAVRYGIEGASAARDVVLLLHVVEGASVLSYTVGERPRSLRDMLDPGVDFFRSPSDQRLIRRDLCEEARWKLAALVPPGWRGHIRTVVTAGRAADAIARVGEEEHADLILLGARGPRGWRRVLRRTLADRVRRRARIPVVTLNSDDPRRGRRRRAADSDEDALNGRHDPEVVLVGKRV